MGPILKQLESSPRKEHNQRSLREPYQLKDPQLCRTYAEAPASTELRGALLCFRRRRKVWQLEHYWLRERERSF